MNMLPENNCQHETLLYQPSSHAGGKLYQRHTTEQLLAAAQPSGRLSKKNTGNPIKTSTFPGPLVLPGDVLADDDPKEREYSPQSVLSWTREKDRLAPTEDRKTIYVVPPPKVMNEVGFLNDWVNSDVASPRIEDVIEYLKAFYHGLLVTAYEATELQFIQWDQQEEEHQPPSKNARAKESPPRIGLRWNNEACLIRTRASHEDGKILPYQMNLNDLIDVLIEPVLPSDAFAILMLVPYDLYESEDDDFCCGRAFGGSRVSVVSMARYAPSLDEQQGVEREHAWPASHCLRYVDACCEAEKSHTKKRGRPTVGAANGKNKATTKTAMTDDEFSSSSAIRAAITASSALPNLTQTSLTNLWLSRICKTASHELAHCFGLDHCVYYACIMQSTANLNEDARQPPYLCPIDLVKVLRATGSSERGHLEALRGFCERFAGDRLFAGLGAWLGARLEELERDERGLIGA